MLVEHLGGLDALDPEVPVVGSQLAPGADQGDVDVIGHGDRPDDPVGAPALLVGIGDVELAEVADRGAHLGEVGAFGLGRHAGRDIDRRVGDVLAQALGHHDGNLGQHAFGRRLQLGVLQASDQPRADGDRLDLVDGEHQRRQVEALAQHVADAGGALDRHAARLQGGDVAIDRARGHLQLAASVAAVVGRLAERRRWMMSNRRSERRIWSVFPAVYHY